jgi:hypothetical protein
MISHWSGFEKYARSAAGDRLTLAGTRFAQRC